MDSDSAHHYRRGRGIYERDFILPEGVEGKRLWLRFGAVAQRGWVFFDDEQIGEHHGGYSAFTVEIPNRAGRIRVIADNHIDRDLAPSDMSDFFLYGGITRSVRLYATDSARIVNTFFDTTVNHNAATIDVRGVIDADMDHLTVHIELFYPDDNQIAEVQTSVSDTAFSLTLPTIESPELWSPYAPNLYRSSVRLLQDDVVLDEVEQQVGLRWFDFPTGGPFYLNGERLLLRGTHRHDDWAGYGAAVPHHLIDQELRQIKQVGFNFLRLGHYPQDDHVLQLCDQLGIIVWEEIPWCRGGVGGEVFKSHTRNMLNEMIEQHYNHPSIFFWGLGNELDWESEHPDSTDERVADFLAELHRQAKAADPHRLTALRRFEPGAAIVDVYSPSIWSGWYRGRYKDYEAALTLAMDKFAQMLHIEWGGDSHVGRHNDGPHIQTHVEANTDHGEVPGTATSKHGFARYSRDGDWSESYIIDLMAHHLAVQSKLPNLAGSAQWIFKDFGTPLRPENPIPYVNQKGLVTRDGTPKDVLYVFQAFQSNEPIVRIESSAWETRVISDGKPVCIRVITNCECVEIFIDGDSYGRKRLDQSPAGVLEWNILSMRPGDYQLDAIGYTNDEISARHTIHQEVMKGNANPVAAYIVTHEHDRCIVQLVDRNGLPVTTDERRVHFDGDGIACYHGTMGKSNIVETANGRAWISCRPDTQVRVVVEGLEEFYDIIDGANLG